MARLSQNPADLAPFIVTPADTQQARRVQTANITADRPSNVEREIGNESIVGRTFDPPNVTLNINANLVNARLLAMIANRDPDATFTNQTVQDLLGNADIDLMMLQRNAARSAWLQAVYVRQASIGTYTINASTDASATETFELAADNKTAFERKVNVDNDTAGSNGDSSYTLSATPVALTAGAGAGNKLISASYAHVNGPSIYMTEGTDFSVSGTTVTITNADIIADIVSGDQFAFAYQHSGTLTGDPFQPKDTISPAAIRGYYHIPVSFTVSGSNLSVPGMQSIQAAINFGQSKEVGMGSQLVGAFRQTPADVTGNFVIFEEGYNVEELLISGSTSPTQTDFPIDAYRDDIVITIQFKHPDTGVVLRTDVLSGVTITGDGRDISVGQAVGKQFNFASSDNFGWYVTKHV